MSWGMRFPTILYVRPVKAQTSLRIHAVWSEPLLVAWIIYMSVKLLVNIIWSSKLKRSLQRLIWVYTCQNATLLEITCHCSYGVKNIWGINLKWCTLFDNKKMFTNLILCTLGNLKKKIKKMSSAGFKNTISECQKVWIQIDPSIMSSLSLQKLSAEDAKNRYQLIDNKKGVTTKNDNQLKFSFIIHRHPMNVRLSQF